MTRRDVHVELIKLRSESGKKEVDNLITSTNTLINNEHAGKPIKTYEYGYYLGKHEAYLDMTEKLDKLIDYLDKLESEEAL